jgi:hypothetical protein
MSASDQRTVPVPGDHEIELASGAYLDLAEPDPSVITLDVVAHALGNTCRYAGHTRRFYSVAEHAVMVARWLRVHGHPAHVQLGGLHHDDAEAFVADIARPLKSLLGDVYRYVEQRLHDAAWAAFDLPMLTADEWEFVKMADNWALACEAWHLLPSQGRGWWSEGIYDPDHRPAPSGPYGLRPEVAAKSWLDEHAAIRGAMKVAA